MLYRWKSRTFKDYTLGSIYVEARSVKAARLKVIASAKVCFTYDLQVRKGVEYDVAGEPDEIIKDGVSFVMGSA